jgi:hypothetical protein
VTDDRNEQPGGEALAPASLADEMLDELVPAEVDWRNLIARYPKATLAAVGLFGLWLGRSRGGAILDGFSRLVADTVDESINELVGRDLL